MKMKREVLLIALALAGLYLTQQASAVYNPQTGRWLSRDPAGEPGFELLQHPQASPASSRGVALPQGRLFHRDPIEERGVKNLYGYVNNNPIRNIDALGLRMVLQVQAGTLPAAPTQGPLEGVTGATMWAPFHPRAKVYKSIIEPCCWKVNFFGFARILWWNVPGAITHDGRPVYEHELDHVALYRQMFKEYNDEAERIASVCRSSEPKARCYSAVITGILADTHLSLNSYKNWDLDFWDWGGGREFRDYYAARYSQLSQQLATEVQRCNQMP